MTALVQKSINYFDPSALLANIFATAWVWNFRMQSRRDLANLDARLLEDIGVSSQDAKTEAEKVFWQ